MLRASACILNDRNQQLVAVTNVDIHACKARLAQEYTSNGHQAMPAYGDMPHVLPMAPDPGGSGCMLICEYCTYGQIERAD